MRNDEKIDINLATEDTSENLSEEELAQQNYETALRYINIAEHMSLKTRINIIIVRSSI